MNLIEIFSIIIIHWIADFVCQSHWQATNKSKNNYALLAHTITYSVIWAFLAYFTLFWYLVITREKVHSTPELLYWFIPITFVCHTITDYFTSRLNTKLWNKGDVHNFFVSVGFDQVLHYIQLFTTYWLLK